MEDLTIISGGQTGADRAALDFAIRQGFAHGGWCPLGRLAEDGPLAPCYLLEETPSRKYDQRTKWNVRDSDVTLLLTIDAEPTGGTALTIKTVERLGKPWLHLSRDATTSVSAAGAEVRRFLEEHNAKRINVAGPRISQQPEVGAFVHEVLTAALLSE